MTKLQLRVIPDSPTSYRWLITDHIWDGISAPIAVSSQTFDSEEEAQAVGRLELQRIQGEPARDHPFIE